MILYILFLAAGFILLFKSADWLVSGATALALRKNISNFVIGLTIVAFGTSAPELVVNFIASFNDHPDIVLGNVIGSNNFNLFVILGIVGLIFPITVQANTVKKEIPKSLIAILILFILANFTDFYGENVFSRLDGMILLLLFTLYIITIFHKPHSATFESMHILNSIPQSKVLIHLTGGLTGLIIGAHIVINNSVEIAHHLNINDKLIGLTILAAGTSLPELAASSVAAFRKNSDIAIGNVLGSNIFNILFILPISSFINPIEYNSNFNTDIYILGGGTTFLFMLMLIGTKYKLSRWKSGCLLLIFVLYSCFLLNK